MCLRGRTRRLVDSETYSGVEYVYDEGQEQLELEEVLVESRGLKRHCESLTERWAS